jgi:predicted ATPase/DNA-binding SARP family transcriptional activator
MSQLRLHLLGAPRIEIDEVPIVVDRRKATALLIYLALTRQFHQRDTLATLFWPDQSQKLARGNLRRTLSGLNQALDREWLELDHEKNVALKQHESLWIDVVSFQGLLEQRQRHDHAQNKVCSACLPLLAEAVTLYRGDFLTGFTLQDSPDFDDWQLFQTERLRQALAEALAHLVQGYAGQGEFKTALAYAQRWLSLDPLHEPAHRALIELYAQAGDRAAALRQYQACTHFLQEELGLSPSSETVQLYETIKATQGGSRVLTEGVEEGARGQRSRGIEEQFKIQSPHNLPVSLTPMLGREGELRDLSRLLAESELRLITLVGPGGIGKTHLALEVARQQLQQFPDGVYFVSLASIESPMTIIATVAKALNFSFYEGITPQQQLCDYLRQKRLLLVLDNFEHLLDPPSSSLREGTEGSLPAGLELMMAWLQAAPALKVLVTSRARLKLQGEQLFLLEGIDFPHSEEEVSQEISRYSAVQLFVQAARRLRLDFQLTGGEAPAVAQICRLMQGMPLGILLAAAGVDLLKPTEIARQIGQSLDFLAGEWRDLPARQQSLRAVFDHSWRLLTAREQAVFQQLSVFRGGFSEEAARAVVGAFLPELRALVNKSLLRFEAERYEIHELLRQYGAEKLAAETAEASETSTVSAVHNCHSAYYCAFLQARETDLKGARQQLALAELQAEHENIQLAWRWAVEQGQVEQLAQAVDSLGFFYDWRGRFQEGESVFQMASGKLTSTTETLPILAKLSAWQALFCRRMGRTEQAHQLFQKSLSCLNNPGLPNQNSRSEKAFVLFEMGDFMIDMDYQEARRMLEQSLILYQTLRDRWAAARALNSLSDIATNLSMYEEAQQQLQEGLALHQELGDQRSIAQILTSLGYVARHRGQLEEAEQLQWRSLRLIEKLGDRAGLAEVYKALGASLLWLGRFSDGARYFEEAVVIYRHLGHHHGLAESNGYLAEAMQHLGWYEQMQAYNQMAFTLHRDAGNQLGIGVALLRLSFLALVKETYLEAQQLLHEGAAMSRKVKHQVWLGNALSTLGGMASVTHNFQQAQEYLVEPLQIALKTRAFYLLHVTLAWVALFLANQGQPERAVEIYTLASRFPYVGNSRWFEAVAGRHVAAAAAALPPEVVAAAQERGRARDAWAAAEALLAELRG